MMGGGAAASPLGITQSSMESAKAQLGGQAGIDAIYAQLGGKEKVMEMIKSGQGLPPGFKMPTAIMNLVPQQQQQQGGSYDYEYYDSETGDILPPLNTQSFSQYPLVPPPSTRLTPPAASSPQAEKATGVLDAVGGQKAIDDVYSSLGGKAGIEAIYESLGGRDAVMRMVQSGQGLPPGFKLPQQIMDLTAKLSSAAKSQEGSAAGGYDYEYYYVDDNGVELPTTTITSVISASSASKPTVPVTPPAPLFAPPNPSFVSGGGSLFEFLDTEEEVVLPSKKADSVSASAPAPAPAAPSFAPSVNTDALPKKTITDRVAAAQNRVIGRR